MRTLGQKRDDAYERLGRKAWKDLRAACHSLRYFNLFAEHEDRMTNEARDALNAANSVDAYLDTYADPRNR